MISNQKQIDLHTHTSKSDGSYTPTELVDYAIQKALIAVAITDHDTTDGLDEAISYAALLNRQGKPSIKYFDITPLSFCL